LIVSAAERAGCTLIFSEELSDGQLYHDIEVLDPFIEERYPEGS
jgi:predicted nucleic acid-binding protein